MGYVGKDCDLLGWFNGDRNKRAIGAEELVYLLVHRDKYKSLLGGTREWTFAPLYTPPQQV